MNTLNVSSPSNIRWLAKRMEDDIRTRGLREGEPYFTTAQAGRQLGTSKAMAYRAMKILAARQVLVSHPGRGTFVGPQANDASTDVMRSVHLVMTQHYFQSSGQATHGWLTGLSALLPGYSVQFNFLPPKDPEAHVSRLLDQGLKDGTLAAVVLAGCPQVVQEQVLQRGVPAVVLGTDYSSTRQLPSVDADQEETGRLAAEYLLNRGHRRIALLMREMWFPGDRSMFEGVGRELDRAGLGHAALTLRNLSVDPTVVEAELRRLLTMEDRPTGCICRNTFFAEAAVRVAQSIGLNVPKDFDVVTSVLGDHTSSKLSLPGIYTKVSSQEQMAIGGRMLSQLFAGQQLDPPIHVTLPVELVEPQEQGVAPKSSGSGRSTTRKSQ